MKLSWRILAIFFWTLIAASAQTPAQQQQRTGEMVPLPFNSAPYRIGERLTYNVSFSNFNTAAHVELFVAGRGNFFNREGLQLRAHVETTGVVSAALYSINNDYTSYVDQNSGLPFRTQQLIREAGRLSDTSSDYNQPAGIAAIPGKTLAGTSPGTYDLVSAFYRFRSLPLMEGSLYHISVRSDPDQYDVELRVTGREMVKTNVGSFETIATQLRINGNPQANNYKVRIYFSDDERHVPVLITAQHPSGEIRAELVASELPTNAPPVVPPVNTAIVPTPAPIGTQVADGNAVAGNGTFLSGLPFSVGEQLNYNVYLSSVVQPVGQASFQVRARTKYFNHDGLQLSAKAQTTNAAQRLFFANDQINSYVDPTTLVPFRTDLALVEGQRRTTQTITFEQDRGTAVTDKGQRVEIPVGTHDYISVMYALRSFNLAPPKRNAVSLLVNNRPTTLFVTSLKREMIELGGQKIPAIQISLTTDDPQPDKFSLRLWVSEDRRRLPLRLTANTALGPLRADLAIIPTSRQ
ncbi:MAG: hypothetical protein QOD00_582 [Blastocatellia bacterium]|nr:hypothetical protein [Blastocatellia bacterium]